ncbi:hypothetical protein ACOME3_004963 [Neoechinorhynchus agilis]
MTQGIKTHVSVDRTKAFLAIVRALDLSQAFIKKNPVDPKENKKATSEFMLKAESMRLKVLSDSKSKVLENDVSGLLEIIDRNNPFHLAIIDWLKETNRQNELVNQKHRENIRRKTYERQLVLKICKCSKMNTVQDLNAMSNEVEKVSRKVEEIARLQSAFAENVLSQSELIDRFADETETTMATLTDTNRILQNATATTSSLHVHIFIVIVLTFSLAFLHWYNE